MELVFPAVRLITPCFLDLCAEVRLQLHLSITSIIEKGGKFRLLDLITPTSWGPEDWASGFNHGGVPALDFCTPHPAEDSPI